MEKEVWTPLRLIKWTTEYFKRHGVEEPRLDAELLLAKVLGVERIMLYALFERVVTEDELKAFREMVSRRAAGVPAKYIIGRTEFYSLPFKVDERVLIPRAETELLVERALAVLEAAPGEARAIVVEIGTGSGAIVVSMARHRRAARYIATDVSPAALEVARENAAANGVEDSIEFVEGDLFEPLETLGVERAASIIVSNPPYVRSGDLAALAREIREHEPIGALVAGSAGTEVQERLLAGAPRFLVGGGVLLMEMDNDQKSALEEIAARSAEYEQAVFHQDYSSLWRVVEARRI